MSLPKDFLVGNGEFGMWFLSRVFEESNFPVTSEIFYEFDCLCISFNLLSSIHNLINLPYYETLKMSLLHTPMKYHDHYKANGGQCRMGLLLHEIKW